jgi:hypothetical protein
MKIIQIQTNFLYFKDISLPYFTDLTDSEFSSNKLYFGERSNKIKLFWLTSNNFIDIFLISSLIYWIKFFTIHELWKMNVFEWKCRSNS